MNPSKRRVEGFDYLYQRGGSFEVRVQVPRALRPTVGKGELKKSLGGDFAKVRRAYHRTVADLQGRIEVARRSVVIHPPTSTTQVDGEPTPQEIDVACYDHFQLMVANIRGKAMSPDGSDDRTREERIDGLRQMIAHQLDVADYGAWSTMSAQADWLIEEMGWNLDQASPTFEYLCQMMLRARLQALRDELRKLEGKFAPDHDADPLFGSKSPISTKEPTTLGDLVAKFKAAREVNWTGSTKKNYIIIFRVIEEICGKTTPLADINADFCIELRDRLQDVPANYHKRPSTRGKPLAEAVAIASREGLPVISPATVNSHLNKFGAIVRFGRDRGWIVGNPMAGIDVKEDVSPDEKRDPFRVDQLNLIFACEPWASGFGAGSARPSRYWAPLIALFSGARLTEICGQLVTEMVEVRGMPVFDFRHRPGVRDLKNDRSRIVPVHPELIRLGLWDFVEEARQSGRELLFTDVSRDKLGKWGDGTSKWFSRLIKKLGLSGRALSFHSLRHTFEDGLKEADLHNTPIGNEITGRRSPGVSAFYGSNFTLAKLATAIEKVHFSGLQLPPYPENRGQA
ncbi:MAG: site-specific integrase [Erythrobacter sp.]|jgi:integrase